MELDALRGKVEAFISTMHPKDAKAFRSSFGRYGSRCAQAIGPHERILGATVASSDVLIVTSVRLTSNGPGGAAEFFLNELSPSKIEATTRPGFGYVPTLKIFADEGGNRYLLYYISKRAETTQPFIEALMEGVRGARHSPAAATSAGASVADEIRKLGDLLKDGLITQAEFDSRKAQLLG